MVPDRADQEPMGDAGILMKLDAIKISGRYRNLTNRSGSRPIRALEQRLRKFFDEADGHGSLRRKPPADLMTHQYFKLEVAPASCNPIRRMDWIAFVNYANYKKLAKTMVKKQPTEQPPPPTWAQKNAQKQQLLAPPAPTASAIVSVTPETQVDRPAPKEVSIAVTDVGTPKQIDQESDGGQIERRRSIVNIMLPDDVETDKQIEMSADQIERRRSIVSIIISDFGVPKQSKRQDDSDEIERRPSIVSSIVPDLGMPKQIENETDTGEIERRQSIVSITVPDLGMPKQIENQTDASENEQRQSIVPITVPDLGMLKQVEGETDGGEIERCESIKTLNSGNY